MAECLFHVLNRRHIDESELLPDGNINVGAGCISSGENLGECSHPQALRLHEAGPSRDFDSVLRGGGQARSAAGDPIHAQAVSPWQAGPLHSR